jgi:uncharacterized protein YlxW (UPF0749 family)
MMKPIRMEEIEIKIKTINIFIALLSFIAVAFIVNGVDANIDQNTIYIIKNLNHYEKNIEDMRNVVEKLKAEVDTEKKFMNGYENSSYLDDIISINAQIEELKFYNGFTDVRGPGIYLRVSDSTSEDESLDIMERIIHDVDITVLLNDLKAAGAEAIDVNSKRIINISEVVCAGPVLQINGEAVPAPFVIRAIGDMENLYDSITEEGTYAYNLKNNYGMEIEAKMVYNMSIPKYKRYGYEYGDGYEVKYAVSAER